MEKEVMLSDRISAVLGRGSRSTIVSSASLAVICLFYVYSVGTFFQVRVYPLIDRITHYIPFDFYVVNEYVDHLVIGCLFVLWLAFSIQRGKAGYVAIGAIAALVAGASVANSDLALDAIALSALPAIVGLLIYSRYSRRILNNDSKLWMNYLAILGIVIGIASFAIAVSTIATDNTAGYPIERNYAYGVFVLLSSASPILMLLLITCFPVKLLIDFVAAKIKRLQVLDVKDIVISAKTKAIYLALFVLLSIIIAIIPHLGTVNIDNQSVGVDTRYYVEWLGMLNNSNSGDFLYQAFIQQGNGDRPISLLFIYALQQITDADPFFAIEYTPVLLGPALVLVIYFLTRELTSNNVTSLLAAFLTAISFHVLIGIYAGFYANWLALVFGYLSFLFLFKFLKNGRKKHLLLYFSLLTLTLFTHIYTWSVLAIVAGVFLASMLRMKYYSRRNSMMLIAALLATVVIDLTRMSLTGSSGSIEEDLLLAEQLVGPDQFTLRWNNLTYATTTFVGGLFANFIVLGLGLYWLVRARIKEPANIFIIVFFSIGILPFLFGDWQVQTRIYYNIPFQIPAAIALYHIRKKSNFLIMTACCVWFVAMAMISVSNFYLIFPQ